MMDKVPMTAGGYAALEDELKQRQSERASAHHRSISRKRARTAICRRTPSITPRRKSSRTNEGRIAELEDKLARADIIDISKLSGDTIKFGATVHAGRRGHRGRRRCGRSSARVEADAKKGRISITSPLARAR